MWYFFRVAGGKVGQTVQISLMDLNQVAKVYNQDLRPCVRVAGETACWRRHDEPAFFKVFPDRLMVTFCYTFHSPYPVYFAFYYPFSYSDNQRLLNLVDARLQFPAVTGLRQTPRRQRQEINPRDIYYHRELLVRTPEKRRVELLTISSFDGMYHFDDCSRLTA